MPEGYVEGQQPNTGDRYGQFISEEWIEISQLGRQVRRNLLAKNYDPDPLYDFVSGLCDLLMQLKPKVKGRSMSDKNLSKTFLDYSDKYASDPQKILDLQKEKLNLEDAETRKETIFKIEETIRSVIEELGITDWGDN